MTLDQKYSTGVVWQDFQHKELMDLFIKLKKARADKTDRDAFRFTIAFLSMYINHHFKLEEEYMDLYYYPDREDHKKEHRSYIKTLKSFRANHKTYSEEAMDELMTKIKEWILNHILGDDKKLGAHILSAEKAQRLGKNEK
ncbi:bacteriohemerythrin [Desulfospira joergensenii]|uniref:bacteriohemerythrin n=1 Tax=Desulfospira joergensenii TaxID=53329 RepID=UPI0003B6EEE5|nr:hemerythrin family protein [Desulfospira joergensenii]